MSKKELKNRIDILTLELFQTEHAWENDADYVKYRDLAIKAKAKNLKANESKLDALYKQINQLEETYKLFSVKEEYKLPDNLEEFRIKCMNGVDYGPKGLVPVMSWNARFVLLKKPGHNAWCGIGDSRYYPTEYSLHDIYKKDNDLNRGRGRFENSMIFEAEGLNTKKAIEKAEKYINTLKGK